MLLKRTYSLVFHLGVLPQVAYHLKPVFHVILPFSKNLLWLLSLIPTFFPLHFISRYFYVQVKSE